MSRHLRRPMTPSVFSGRQHGFDHSIMLILRVRAALSTWEGLVILDEASYYGPVWTVWCFYNPRNGMTKYRKGPQRTAKDCECYCEVIKRETLRPNSFVAIIIKATGFSFWKKPKKRSIYTQHNVAEKCKLLAIFLLLIILCGICMLSCSP